MIGAVILAAGSSRRMGQPKQLLEYRGRSLLRSAIDAAREAGCRPVVVVLGAAADRIRPELLDLFDVRIVTNMHWSEGMASSIRTGIKTSLETEPDVGGAILMTCDQPKLGAAVLRKLMQAHDPAKVPLAACEYDGNVGVPALFDRRLFDDLMQLEGDRGARAVLLSRAGEIGRVPWPDGVVDVDTPEDFAALGDGSGGTDPAKDV
jgi:molybdenum cofactor cytidylyltransferase